jgi:hypothetical protein
MDHNAFYNAVGWGPMIVANLPPLIWFLIVSIMIRKQEFSRYQLPLEHPIPS